MALDYAKAYQQFIDEAMAEASATAWMVPEAGKVRFTGGRDVEISTLSTGGLGNYDAAKTDGTAYPSGAVSNVWKSYPMAMDRGVQFSLDRTGPSDTGFIATAGNVIREFARNALVKEQDAYRVNKLYALCAAGELADTHVVSATLTKTNALATVSALLQTLRDDGEAVDGFVAMIAHKHLGAFLEAAKNTYHELELGASVEINGVRYDNVALLDGLPCIFVPQSRMQTKLTVHTGAGDGGGVAPATDSKNIACLITHASAPLAVGKLDSIKQFGPEENQLFDGTSIQARFLYDLFVPSAKLCAVGAVVEP